MSIDREQLRMVVALTVVALVAAAVLGLTDIVTRAPIAEAQRAALAKALSQVLPAHSNEAQRDVITVVDGERSVEIYPARNAAGQPVGYAWEAVAPDGYSGSIHILVGVNKAGRVHAIRVIDHKETPGLGDGIVKNGDWLAFFAEKGLTEADWRVKKDGGDFDQFTGATISPRAVVKAVKKALEFFERRQEAIVSAHLPTGDRDGGTKRTTELQTSNKLGATK